MNSLFVSCRLRCRTKRGHAYFVIFSARANAVYITGSGTSYHAALVAKYLLAKFTKIRAESVMSSEFQYVLDFIDKNSVLVAFPRAVKLLTCFILSKD